jgi:hypothetical protein
VLGRRGRRRRADGHRGTERRAGSHGCRLRVEDVPLAVLAGGARHPTSVPDPATDFPHLEVHSGKGKRLLDSQNVAYADGTSATTNDACTPAELPGGGSASLRSTSQAKQLDCKFRSNPVFVAVPESTVEFPSLSALVDDALVVNAQLGDPGVGSFLDYDAKLCKVKDPPRSLGRTAGCEPASLTLATSR